MPINARFLMLLFICIWSISSCKPNPTATATGPTPSSEPTAAPKLEPDKEEYAVYTALIESTSVSENTKQVLIVDQTRDDRPEALYQFLADLQKSVPLEPELVASFKERNQQPLQIEPSLELGVKYQLLSQEQIDELYPQDEASGWKLFYQKYPDTVGFLYLSRAGFNADLSQALVCIARYHYVQPLLGGCYLLTRQDGGWMVGEGVEWIT